MVAATAVRAETLPPLPLAKDLFTAAEDARTKRIPVMIAFTTRVCPYCRVARRDHLQPMYVSAKWRDKAIMLDMQLDTADTLTDFEGKVTTVREFAKRMGVRSVPTVIVFDGSGQRTGTPLVGLMGADFYTAYLEQAVEDGLVKMRYPQ